MPRTLPKYYIWHGNLCFGLTEIWFNRFDADDDDDEDDNEEEEDPAHLRLIFFLV